MKFRLPENGLKISFKNRLLPCFLRKSLFFRLDIDMKMKKILAFFRDFDILIICNYNDLTLEDK